MTSTALGKSGDPERLARVERRLRDLGYGAVLALWLVWKGHAWGP
jgi:hypothetical protein